MGKAPEIQEIFAYFEETFIGKKVWRRRAIPLFELKVWNIYDRVLANLPRTNNSVEGWHHAFDNTMRCHHPDVYALVEEMQKENNLQRTNIIRGETGKPKHKKQKYQVLDDRIFGIVNGYEKADVLHYLSSLSYVVKI